MPGRQPAGGGYFADSALRVSLCHLEVPYGPHPIRIWEESSTVSNAGSLPWIRQEWQTPLPNLFKHGWAASVKRIYLTLCDRSSRVAHPGRIYDDTDLLHNWFPTARLQAT